MRLSGVSFSNASTLMAKGVLEGYGQILGNVTVTNATPCFVRPGGTGAAGELRIGGAYQQRSGILNLEIGGVSPGSGYDVLSVTNGVTLSACTIAITNLAGFKPPAGASAFDVVTGSSVTTNGATIVLPPAADGVGWSAVVATLADGRKALRVSSVVRSRGAILLVR